MPHVCRFSSLEGSAASKTGQIISGPQMWMVRILLKQHESAYSCRILYPHTDDSSGTEFP